MFWYFVIALLALAAVFVVLPIWRFHRDTANDQSTRERTNILIFKERIEELERERDSGLLEAENFDALKAELERSLLIDVETVATQKSESLESTGLLNKSRLVPIVMFVLAIPLSVFFYDQWGFSEELELAGLYERTRVNPGDPEEATALVRSLGEIVRDDSENGWAWYFLGQNLVSLGQFPEASMTFELASRYIEQDGDKAVVLSQHAFLEYMLADQELNDDVQAIIARVQRLDPNQMLIFQILSMNAERNADYQSAITYWRRMLQMTPPGEESDALRQRIGMAQEALLASGSAQERAIVNGPTIDVELTVAADLDLPPETRVFISALEENGRGQPLAAEVITLADLPITISLDNSDAVGPFNLSSAEMVYIVATASVSGTANVQSGDYRSRTQAFAHLNTHAILQLEIKDLVP